MCIILAYVDDPIFVSSDNGTLELEVSSFLSQFEGTDEPLEWYIGDHLSVDNGIFDISQSAYFDETLTSFAPERCRTYTTPMVSNLYDELQHHSTDEVNNADKYRNMIRSLQFLARWSKAGNYVIC